MRSLIHVTGERRRYYQRRRRIRRRKQRRRRRRRQRKRRRRAQLLRRRRRRNSKYIEKALFEGVMARICSLTYNNRYLIGSFTYKPHLHALKNRHGTTKCRHRADDLSARHVPFTRLYQKSFYDLSTVLAIILAPLKSCSCVSRPNHFSLG